VVVGKHAFRNALIPVVTFSGLVLGFFMNGAVVAEVVFAWPGVGLMILDSVFARDFPVVQMAVVMVGAFFVLINIIVDLLYVVIDPRIKY
jgi:ABC-type dipeptide/oligopeptide/nickel transport system permease component